MAVAHTLRVLPNPVLDRLEGWAYDARIRAFPAAGATNTVAIVDIDTRSLQEVGRWPWPRAKVAELVDRLLHVYQVNTLGLDLVFSEPETETADRHLAATLAGQPVVLGYYFSGDGGTNGHEAPLHFGLLPPPAMPVSALGARRSGFTDWTGYVANTALVAKGVPQGHFNPWINLDGVVRKIPLLAAYEGKLYPSLALEMVRVAIGGTSYAFDTLDKADPTAPVETVRINAPGETAEIPVDEELMISVPFRGRKGSFDYVAAADVLAGTVAPERLKDKVVLVGTTAPGLFDLRVTPVDIAYPGVEIHANAIAAMLDQTLLRNPSWTVAAELLMVLGAFALTVVAVTLLPPLAAIVAMLALIAGIVALNGYWWAVHYWTVPIATSLSTVVLAGVALTSSRWLRSVRHRNEVAALFGEYVPREVVSDLIQSRSADLMAPVERELSILFTDIAGFVTTCRSLSPQQVAAILRSVLTPLSGIVHAERGTIDKYIGDAIMAFWGAPIATDAHAVQAVRAALRMRGVVAAINQELIEAGLPAVEIGIGINTGSAFVGNMGSSWRRTYTAIGDSVNLASRIEGATRQCGAHICVGPRTVELTRSSVLYRRVDRVLMPGYAQPFDLYEPLALASELTPESSQGVLQTLASWEEGFGAYLEGSWARAKAAMSRFASDPVYGRSARGLLARLDALERRPRELPWDGVWTIEKK
jgi:adenylate cyclase